MFSRIERIVKEKEKYVVLRVKYLREDLTDAARWS